MKRRFLTFAFAAAAAAMAFRPLSALESKNFDISELGSDTVHRLSEGYSPGAFSSLDASQQKDAIDRARLATYAYPADGSRETAIAGMDYRPLTRLECEKILAGTNLVPEDAGRGDGSYDIINPKQKGKFSATLLQNTQTGEIVISYRGTDASNKSEWIQDDLGQIAVPMYVPQQYKDASTLLGAVMKCSDYSSSKITCVGDSLGGGLTAYAMSANGTGGGRVSGVTFDAAGLSESTIESLNPAYVRDAAAHIVNYANSSDPVHAVGYLVGEAYTVYTAASGKESGSQTAHSVELFTANARATMQANPATAQAYSDYLGDDYFTDRLDKQLGERSDLKKAVDEAARKERTERAVEELKQQIRENLPSDAIKRLEGSLDAFAEDPSGNLAQMQQLVDAEVQYPGTAAYVKQLLGEIAGGVSTTIVEDASRTGIVVGKELLSNVLGGMEGLDQALADKVADALKRIESGGKGTIDSAELAALFAAIDASAPNADSATALKDLLANANSGTDTAADWRGAASEVSIGASIVSMQNAGMPQDQIDTAVAAMRELGADGYSEYNTQEALDYIHDEMEHKYGTTVADSTDTTISSATQTTPGSVTIGSNTTGTPTTSTSTATKNPWSSIWKIIKTKGTTIAKKVLAQVQAKVADKIDSFIAKHPALAKICEIFGINGKGVIESVKKVWSALVSSPNLATFFTKLGSLIKTGISEMLLNAIKWGLKQLWNLVWSKVIVKVIDKLCAILDKWSAKTSNPLVKLALAQAKKALEKLKAKQPPNPIHDSVATNIRDVITNILFHRHSTP